MGTDKLRMFTSTNSKYCQDCGEGTVKPDRESCKHCGSKRWVSTKEDVVDVYPGVDDKIPLLRAEAEKSMLVGFEDHQLRKFLCARKGDVARAAELLRAHCEWKRQKFGMGHLDQPRAEDVLEIAQSGMLSVPGVRDKDGCLVLFVRPAQLDGQRFTPVDLVRLLWYVIDKACDDPMTCANGFTVVEDLSDMDMAKISSLVPAFPKEIIQGLIGAVPARLRAIYLAFQPYGFATMFSVAKTTFIPSKLGSKIYVCGTDMEQLHAHVPAVQLPCKLGGSCEQDLADFHQAFLHNREFFPAAVA